MKENRQEIPVFFTIDDQYAPYLAVAMVSLMENASRDYDYRLHVVHKGLSEKNRKRLSAMEKEHFKVVLVEMDDTLRGITDRKENRLRCDYFTLAIFFRLLLADMFPQYERGIYIDSDVVITGDISRLYWTRLEEGLLIGACVDHSVENIPEIVRYFEQATGIKQPEYVNSGVLLMNFRLMREREFGRRFLELLNTWHFYSLCPDQDYLNAMCNGRILYLDESWDVMPNKERPLHQNPQIIHYNLFDKPWCYDGIQYEEYFWRYAAETEYYKEIVDFKKNYGKEQQDRDMQNLTALIQSAAAGPYAEITFKKMYDRGIKIRI